ATTQSARRRRRARTARWGAASTATHLLGKPATASLLPHLHHDRPALACGSNAGIVHRLRLHRGETEGARGDGAEQRVVCLAAARRQVARAEAAVVAQAR